MVLIAGEDGAASRAPLQLPMPPLALAAAGLFVVAVCDDGVHVYDRWRRLGGRRVVILGGAGAGWCAERD
jgi:hypothetical protein